ncbi:hypothetical protein [Rhizobium sp.]
MNNGESISANPVAAPHQKPAWMTAVIVLVVLLLLSEVAYVVLGGIAKMCLAEGANCGPLVTGISRSLFTPYDSEGGVKLLSSTFSIGLPGFNNLFYLFVGGVVAEFLVMLLTTTAASLLIGFLIVWGYVVMSGGRNVAIQLLLAVAFAIGWFGFYNYTEASVYGADFLPLAEMRYLEIPIAAASLFVASFFVRQRS